MIDWLTLCVFYEARGEPADGKAAVAKVVLNRTARRFCSDGTIRSTVLWPNQFSWTQWDVVDGHYTKVAHTPEETLDRVSMLNALAIKQKLVWAACEDVAEAVSANTYVGGPEYEKLGGDAVLYLNPSPSLVPHLPAWANPAHRLARVGHQEFFRA